MWISASRRLRANMSFDLFRTATAFSRGAAGIAEDCKGDEDDSLPL
jgi:hypothetical protein